jgi:hypothetical protein
MYEDAPRRSSRPPLYAVGSRRTGTSEDLMEIAAKLAGEPWTDHPECVHPTLGAVARGVYDQTSEPGRAALLPLAPSLVGTACTGLELSARLVATCVSAALSSPLPERIAADRSHRLQTAQRTAFYLMSRAGRRAGQDREPGSDAEQEPRPITRLWLHLLDPVGLTEPVYRRLVSPEVVAEAVVATARASGDAADQRLSQLLRWCIDLTRRGAEDQGRDEHGTDR